MIADQILIVKNVRKRFGGIVALDDCTLSVRRSTITALIGPNGSGKTTLFDIISQIVDEDSGTVHFMESEISRFSSFTAYKVANHGISRTFQDVRLFKHLTIKEHLLLAMNNDDTHLLKNIIAPSKEDEHSIKDITRVLHLVKLDKPVYTKASDLSYGQRKLLDLAVAIIKPHKLLMLDEPVAGVNPAIRQIIKDVLQQLVKNGETILLIEHDMNFTMGLADYVYVLDAGAVIAQGTPSVVRKNKKVLEAYLGD